MQSKQERLITCLRDRMRDYIRQGRIDRARELKGVIAKHMGTIIFTIARKV